MRDKEGSTQTYMEHVDYFFFYRKGKNQAWGIKG